ncbi:hypothetical protein HHK36_022636 [Tetracentron sinense]|uniref:Uncharacterized protein n=1 Tax=Tetracentron sinense TaxID=13715 RepID=A0A834YN87_TETSI|nr:hypothetical protein HHK36_022636 [Tetracentron sinense]
MACVAETPLHIAAMLDHVDFTREILSCKPELACKIDSRQSSHLHLASAKDDSRPSNGDRTILHQCVKYNHLEAFRRLIDLIVGDKFVNWNDDKFVNWNDDLAIIDI